MTPAITGPWLIPENGQQQAISKCLTRTYNTFTLYIFRFFVFGLEWDLHSTQDSSMRRMLKHLKLQLKCLYEEPFY